MMSKLLYSLRSFSLAFLLLGWVQTSAQILDPPEPIANPNGGGSTPWNAACASASFNDYWVNFTWINVPAVNSNNEFVLELSDADGNFTNPAELARFNNKNSVYDFDIQFAIPTDTRGENYYLRIKSTSPEKISDPTGPFPMYYIDFNSPLLMSINGDGNIPPGGTVEVCDGNAVTLAVHNIPNANTYRYNWYKSGTLLDKKSHSITVSQAGMYNVELDYGSVCSGSANTLSNTIDITTGTRLGVAINPPAKTALCSGETAVLEANIIDQGLTYTWYKDGAAITAPTVDDDTYMVDGSVAGFEGDYQVEIDGSGTCLERSEAITITNAGNFTVTRDNPADIVILPGQTKILNVSTTAGSPVYQWYKDGSPISGATNNSLEIAQPGVYYARVSQSGGDCASTFVNSEATTVVAPASFKISIDYTTAYAACEKTSIVLGVKTIYAVASDGSKTDVTPELLTRFAYQWKKEGVDIDGETSSTISLTNISENGNYTVKGSLSTYDPKSNTLPVQLLVSETLTISSSGSISCDPNETIAISTATDLSTETFDWFKDGVNLNDANTTLSVNQPGTYQLVVDRNGCPLRSNEIVISPLYESLVTMDAANEVVFPEGSSKTVTASGGTSYQWFDPNNVMISNTASVTLTQEGMYTVIVNIDNCQVTKLVTASYLDNFRIPNVITINGDGINDQWVIPNSYSNDPKINVIIYNEKGEEVLNEFDYQNDWPQSSTVFPKQNMVFFYKIKNAREVLKQGTITVIR